MKLMKVAKKSPPASSRATLTLAAETYAKIDQLRGEKSRSAWIQQVVAREEKRRDREELLQRIKEEHTPEVVRETLRINDEFPIHES